ncbi:hypothetical protein ABZ443_10830, partial [Streptomyces shenzhenensis]
MRIAGPAAVRVAGPGSVRIAGPGAVRVAPVCAGPGRYGLGGAGHAAARRFPVGHFRHLPGVGVETDRGAEEGAAGAEARDAGAAGPAVGVAWPAAWPDGLTRGESGP